MFVCVSVRACMHMCVCVSVCVCERERETHRERERERERWAVWGGANTRRQWHNLKKKKIKITLTKAFMAMCTGPGTRDHLLHR